jgi:hypothetical protein
MKFRNAQIARQGIAEYRSFRDCDSRVATSPIYEQLMEQGAAEQRILREVVTLPVSLKRLQQPGRFDDVNETLAIIPHRRVRPAAKPFHE